MQHATFAAGCFWGVEELLRTLPGVISTEVGYTGGQKDNPTYHQVCADTTGHAEAVHLTFDETIISYDRLLNEFFSLHNPTTVNRQGPDVGSQYRSAIFYHSEEQKQQAERKIEELQAMPKYQQKIVTQVVPASTFYRAEEYHQKYIEKNGGGVCHS